MHRTLIFWSQVDAKLVRSQILKLVVSHNAVVSRASNARTPKQSTTRVSVYKTSSTMPVFNQDSFKRFVQDNSNAWPCCDVRVTRNNCSPGVVMLMSYQPERKPSATAFKKDTLQHLTITCQVMPVPPSVTAMLECMERHGKMASFSWCDCVVECIWRQLVFGNQVKHECLIVHCLRHRVSDMLCGSVLRRDKQLLVTDSWMDSVIHQCECRGNRDFLSLATYTFECINACVEGHTSPLLTTSEIMASSSVAFVTP